MINAALTQCRQRVQRYEPPHLPWCERYDKVPTTNSGQRESHPTSETPFRQDRADTDRQPRVVIVGPGFGGLAAAKALRKSPARITLIDRRNYHLFQPLLYQVATAGLSPADIAAPIRGIVRHQQNTTVLLGMVQGVDTRRQEVILKDKRLPYDYLIVATGARHAYTDNSWERHAPGLKKIEDATHIRARILMAFEKAEATEDPRERVALLTFLIVGGGPTGVEMAGAIAELAKRALAGDFRNIDPCSARIVLLQRGSQVLPMFPETLSRTAQATLEVLGVEVHTNVEVDHVDDDGAVVSGRHIRARTVIWAAGVIASPAARWLGTDHDRIGRVKVRQDLSVPGLDNVFVVGDTAHAVGPNGISFPGLASVAKQQGRYVARLINAHLRGRAFGNPFRYRNFGQLATVGRSSAVADFGAVQLSGCLAWILWGWAHMFLLIGFRSKFTVMLNWLWLYLTYQRGMRLITGSER